MIKTKRQMFIIIAAFVMVLLLGTTTYAFFNYTRTGVANTVKTGRIYFNAEQNGRVTLDGLFPISTDGNVTASTPGVGSLTIHVQGDTTYTEGIEYRIKAVNVTGSNGTQLPISINISYQPNGEGKTIGVTDDDYFSNRGGNSSIYKLLSTDTITNNGDLVVGYIAPGQTGIDGNIVIMAYLDARNIAISDTYDGNETDNMGTTTNWVNNRQVFTTEEWNALTADGISFQIKAEANEGIWVPAPPKPICRRATTLHTETCFKNSNECYADGYYFNGTMGTTTITYGNLGTAGTLATGDAFDCDINGDGNYTERFYYLSPRWTPGTTMDDSTFDDNYAVLIYYRHSYNGNPSDSPAAYYSSDNWHGPVTAAANLPTTTTWSNISLKDTSRKIVSSTWQDITSSTTFSETTSGGTLPTAFSYSGKAARLLTLPELYKAGCHGDGNVMTLGSSGVLKSCNFLMERTQYAGEVNSTAGLWLETPRANNSSSVWAISSSYRSVDPLSSGNSGFGTRPVIEIQRSRISY